MSQKDITIPRKEITGKEITGLGEINALLGKGTTYEGKLMFDGRVRIDGHFRGEILSDGILVLGEGSEVHAAVRVGTLIVRGGSLRGDVHAAHLVELHAPSQMHGNIHTPQLFIDKGVVFEGRCTMEGTRIEPLYPLEKPQGLPSNISVDASPVAL
jgi:cytoskeletal protein CcmA (bactofilin family)